jgi:hypothetical protein
MIAGFIFLLCIIFFKKIKDTIQRTYIISSFNLNNGKCPGCEAKFNDGVVVQRKAYEHDGIKPQGTDEELDAIYNKKKLIKIESNDLFVVRNLTDSKPYLLSKANNFIYKFCNEYKDSCNKLNLNYIPVIITSATRTRESIKRLRSKNPNSIKESAHLKGKTFDISYTSFGNNNKQISILSNILEKYNKQKACFVKYEKRGCLHITVN